MFEKLKNDYEMIKKILSRDRSFEQSIQRRRTLHKYSFLLARYYTYDRLMTSEAQEIIDRLRSLSLSVQTKRLIYYALRKFYLLLDRKDIVNELQTVRIKTKKKRRNVYLSYSECLDLIENASSFREQFLVRLYLLTGIRLSASLHLRKRHVLMNERIIIIPRTVPGNKAGMEYRTERIPDTLFEMLKFVCSGDKDGYLIDFIDRKKNEQTILWEVNNMISKIAKKIGRENVGPHVLRHTFGVIHYNAYKDILRTRDALGQVSVSSTEIYAHYDPSWEKVAKKVLQEGI